MPTTGEAGIPLGLRMTPEQAAKQVRVLMAARWHGLLNYAAAVKSNFAMGNALHRQENALSVQCASSAPSNRFFSGSEIQGQETFQYLTAHRHVSKSESASLRSHLSLQ